LLGGKVVKPSGELSVPSELGEGYSRRCELRHVNFTVLITVVGSGRGRAGSRWSECRCWVGIDRFIVVVVGKRKKGQL
jgi:hypothetical protein